MLHRLQVQHLALAQFQAVGGIGGGRRWVAAPRLAITSLGPAAGRASAARVAMRLPITAPEGEARS
ncbi:hypothetical protein ACFQU7_14775 [Pseudoroseomonas wenyumeiae]